MIKNKRHKIKRVLTATGLAALRWRMLDAGIYCFCYHRIGDPADCDFSRGVFTCTREHFGEHLGLLKDRFQIINLDQLLWWLDNGTNPPQPLAFITFDDAYSDNYHYAFDELKKYEACATFFVPTAFTGTARLFPWDEVAFALRHASVDRVRLSNPDAEYDLSTRPIDSVFADVIRRIYRPGTRMRDLVDEVIEACKPTTSPPEVRLHIDWPELKEMLAAGMDIGAHTHTHEILSHLDESSQTQELADSKAILESRLGSPVWSVAYPIGLETAYTAATCRIAESVGYKVGFRFGGGFSRPPVADRYRIGRLAPADDNGVQFKSRICFPNL